MLLGGVSELRLPPQNGAKNRFHVQPRLPLLHKSHNVSIKRLQQVWWHLHVSVFHRYPLEDNLWLRANFVRSVAKMLEGKKERKREREKERKREREVLLSGSV